MEAQSAGRASRLVAATLAFEEAGERRIAKGGLALARFLQLAGEMGGGTNTGKPWHAQAALL